MNVWGNRKDSWGAAPEPLNVWAQGCKQAYPRAKQGISSRHPLHDIDERYLRALMKSFCENKLEWARVFMNVYFLAAPSQMVQRTPLLLITLMWRRFIKMTAYSHAGRSSSTSLSRAGQGWKPPGMGCRAVAHTLRVSYRQVAFNPSLINQAEQNSEHFNCDCAFRTTFKRHHTGCTQQHANTWRRLRNGLRPCALSGHFRLYDVVILLGCRFHGHLYALNSGH